MIAQSTGNQASVGRRFVPDGPFDLATQNTYFGGWVTSTQDPGEIVMAFPVEGWQGSVAVRLRQDRTGAIVGSVEGLGGVDLDAGWRQALAVLSLDADGSGYADVGQRDRVVGSLQEEHHHLRPVLFHSPYEAACHFVLAHRISAAQGRRIRQRMAEEHGDQLSLDGSPVSAFPSPASAPRRVLGARGAGGEDRAAARDRPRCARRPAGPGPPARAARRARRRPSSVASRASVPSSRARSCCAARAWSTRCPSDEITMAGVGRLYGLGRPATSRELESIGESWRPYRMWCSVLVHVSERRSRASGAAAPARRAQGG